MRKENTMLREEKKTICGHTPHYAKNLCQRCYAKYRYHNFPEVKKRRLILYKKRYHADQEFRTKQIENHRRWRKQNKQHLSEYYKKYHLAHSPNTLLKQLDTYPWLSETAKKALILDGPTLTAKLKEVIPI